MKRPLPVADPEIPAELSIPYVPALEIADWHRLEQGQLLELHDGQQAILLSVDGAAQGEAGALRMVRVAWPHDSALPLGQTVEMSAAFAESHGIFKVHGVWFAPKGTLNSERVVIEAIYRGFITKRSCGVPWPLAATWQLSAQASDEIEKYLYEVARTTGCAFPFHDITKALQKMHLRLSAENPAQVDIVTGESPGHTPRDDEEMLSLWARTLQQKMLASDFAVTGFGPMGTPTPPARPDGSG